MPAPKISRVRQALRALSTVLIVSGALLIADAGLTLVWQEPISAVYAKLQQRRLAGQLNDLENLTDLQLRALQRLRTEHRRIAFLARLLRRRSEPGIGFPLRTRRQAWTSSSSTAS